MITMNDNAYNYVNLDYLDMMSDGDDEMKKVMLDMLFEELPEEVSKMRSLLQSRDIKELGAVSHKMKSTLAFVGNPEMTDANKQIEELAKSDSESDQFSGLIHILEELIPKAIAELKREYARI
ncbi:MAG: Hpt domain-containing protein [Bacteroidota bacterium]